MSSAETFTTWVTKLRQDYLARRKSARPTSGSDCSSWQTASVVDSRGRGYTYSRGQKDNPFQTLVGQAQNWHSPCVADSDGRPRWDKRASPGKVRKKPVPNLMAQAIEMSGRQSQEPIGLELPSDIGRLNPAFVEWLMGLPAGWTDFAPVGMAWSRWLEQMRSSLL